MEVVRHVVVNDISCWTIVEHVYGVYHTDTHQFFTQIIHVETQGVKRKTKRVSRGRISGAAAVVLDFHAQAPRFDPGRRPSFSLFFSLPCRHVPILSGLPTLYLLKPVIMIRNNLRKF